MIVKIGNFEFTLSDKNGDLVQELLWALCSGASSTPKEIRD